MPVGHDPSFLCLLAQPGRSGWLPPRPNTHAAWLSSSRRRASWRAWAAGCTAAARRRMVSDVCCAQGAPGRLPPATRSPATKWFLGGQEGQQRRWRCSCGSTRGTQHLCVWGHARPAQPWWINLCSPCAGAVYSCLRMTPCATASRLPASNPSTSQPSLIACAWHGPGSTMQAW